MGSNPTLSATTFVVLADGPSLTQEDVNFVRGKAKVIAVNYTIRLAPWADVFYYYHEEQFDEMVGGLDVEGAYNANLLGVVSTHPLAYKIHPWVSTSFSGKTGLEWDPRNGLRSGGNSGHAALNLACQLGAKRVVLLGFDCGPDSQGRWHWFKPIDHPTRGKYAYDDWRHNFAELVPDLKAHGVEVLNASRHTHLTAFPRVALAEALERTDG